MTAYTWNAAEGGDLNTATNWSPNGIPDTVDTAIFALGGDQYTVSGDAYLSGITVNADDVTFTGTIDNYDTGASQGLTATNGATVNIATGADVADTTFAFAPGTTLAVEGTLVSNGGTIDAGIVRGAGALWSESGALTLNQLYVNTGATFYADVFLNDGGTISTDTSATFGAGNILLLGNGTFDVANAAGATNSSFGLFTETVEIGAGHVLTLAADPGVTASIAGGISGQGAIDVSGGNYVFTAADSYTGYTQVDTGGSLTLQGTGAAGTGPIFLDSATLITQADTTGAAGSELVVGSTGADTVIATAGALLVFGGTASSLTFQGGADASTVIGGAGALIATGGTAGDIIFGGTSGNDSLTTGSGPTTLAGGGGTLTATGAATDVLVAGSGNTTLNGAASTGNNIYFTGGTAHALVEAGTGTSTILADGAANTITGATGPQNIFLGAGLTTLEFTNGAATGLEKVEGFTASDTIHLANFSPTEVQTILASALVTGGSTFITLSDNTQIALFGFTGLAASNFG
jgi:hypothetical protein